MATDASTSVEPTAPATAPEPPPAPATAPSASPAATDAASSAQRAAAVGAILREEQEAADQARIREQQSGRRDHGNGDHARLALNEARRLAGRLDLRDEEADRLAISLQRLIEGLAGNGQAAAAPERKSDEPATEAEAEKRATRPQGDKAAGAEVTEIARQLEAIRERLDRHDAATVRRRIEAAVRPLNVIGSSDTERAQVRAAIANGILAGSAITAAASDGEVESAVRAHLNANPWYLTRSTRAGQAPEPTTDDRQHMERIRRGAAAIIAQVPAA